MRYSDVMGYGDVMGEMVGGCTLHGHSNIKGFVHGFLMLVTIRVQHYKGIHLLLHSPWCF